MASEEYEKEKQKKKASQSFAFFFFFAESVTPDTLSALNTLAN